MPILAVENIGRGAVPIDGEWQFHLGDDMRWTAPGYDDSQWERITADKTWGAQTLIPRTPDSPGIVVTFTSHAVALSKPEAHQS